MISCPETNILRLINQKKDLAFILFNHPSYDLDNTFNYLTHVYFDSKTSKTSTILGLEHRVSTLSINDFQKIGLGDFVTEEVIINLQRHTEKVIGIWNDKYQKINYEGIGKSYQTKELCDLQLKMFKGLLKSAAFAEDNFFISFREACSFFKIFDEGFFSHYITAPKVIGKSIIETYFSPILDQLIEDIDDKDTLEYQHHIDTKEIINRYKLVLKKAKEDWFSSPRGAKLWFDALFDPDSQDPRYSFGFSQDEYKAWASLMLTFDLYGTCMMTGEPIPDVAYSLNDPNIRTAQHHLNPNKKSSIALYDLLLPYNKYHPSPFESFSTQNSEIKQKMLRYRLNKLFEIGITKDQSIVRDSKWITEEDFKTMFPETLQYTVRYQGETVTGSLFYLWNDKFSDMSFTEKLGYMNNKVTTIREAISNGRNPYIAYLNEHSFSAKERYYDIAKEFASRFWQLGSERLFENHNGGHLGRIWHISLMKQAFDL